MRDIRPSESSNKSSLPEDSSESALSNITRKPLRPPVRPQSTDVSRPVTPLPSKRPTSIANLRGGSKVPINTVVAPLPPSRPTVVRSTIDTAAPAAPRMRLGYRERMIVVVLLGLLSVAAIMAGLIFLPSASIKLILRTAPLLVDEQLIVRANETTAENVVPGSAFFREVEVKDSASVTSTEVVGKKARGTVTLVNKSVDTQKIKEQSRLVTKDNVLFYMQKSANIPPNGSTTVEVEAAEAGEQGNIAPQRLNFAALDAPSQSLVYGQADKALTGGSGETVSVVKEEDLTHAKEVAGQAARSQIEQEIRNELPKGWVILEESWTQELPAFETEVKVNDRVPNIAYTARVIVRVIGYEKAALESHLKTALEQRLSEDYMLFPGDISYVTTVQDVNWDEAQAQISARVTHTTIPRFSLESLREKLAGRNQKEAQQYLSGLPGVRSATIELSPFWVQSIPRIEKRINLDLQPEKQP